MVWKDLSNDAKSVIEWIENPFTGERETLVIEAGTIFSMDYNGIQKTSITISEALYNEIKTYVKNDEELEYEEKDGVFSFRIKATSSLKLH